MSESWKEEGLPFVLADNKLTVILPNGVSKSISSNNSLFEEVVQAINERNWEVVPDLMDPKQQVSKLSNGLFKVGDDGQVYIDEKQVPNVLGKKIVEYYNSKLPFEPLIAFWKNLNENPSYRAVQELYGFLLANDHPITPDGCFIAYKGVRENFTDCHTGTISNTVGEVVKMPRNQVDEDPTRTCSAGLHVSSWKYAHDSYGGGRGGNTIVVKVNPRDVVAVPHDYYEEKMRVCEYEVMQVLEKPLQNNLYYSADENDPYRGKPSPSRYEEDYEEDYEDEEYEDEEEQW